MAPASIFARMIADDTEFPAGIIANDRGEPEMCFVPTSNSAKK